MKKTLLLSVVASTMIMAGGDIAPVEPVVEAPAAVAAASGWDLGGQAVGFTQTADAVDSLFADKSTYRAGGIQLRATNKDVFAGIGAGVEVTGIQSFDGARNAGFYGSGGQAGLTSGGVTQAYLTYGMGNTSFKVGRQTLPKGLSPFAYSEGWQMFKNTFDAALVVNSDISDTTLVGAYVTKANNSIGNYANRAAFGKLYDTDGTFMVTAQNKSVEGLTLTGTYYLLPSATAAGDANAIWGDAKFKVSDYTVALQGGQIGGDAVPSDTSAFGAKIGANFGMVTAAVAYSSVGTGTLRISNLAGSGIKSPLYTQMLLNNVGQFHSTPDSDFVKVSGTVKALGGKFILGYGQGLKFAGDTNQNYQEIDVMYKTKLTENITGFAAYGNVDQDAGAGANNFVRLWARYNFN